MTTMGEPRLLAAAAAASQLLQRYGIRDPRELVLEDLAMALNVMVIDAPLRGAEARLVRRGDRGLIRVRPDISEPGRRRFAIGHELGHWSQHSGSSQISLCLSSDVVGYRGSVEELEANSFSASLLLPSAYLRERYSEAPSLELVSQIADDLETTLTATAVRVVETTSDPCLVAFTDTESQRVQWWRRSSKCPRVWLERQQPLSELSVAHGMLRDATREGGPEPVDPSAWFEHIDDHAELVTYEQTMRLGYHPTLLTLLSVAHL